MGLWNDLTEPLAKYANEYKMDLPSALYTLYRDYGTYKLRTMEGKVRKKMVHANRLRPYIMPLPV